jgi:fatty acid desaturase
MSIHSLHADALGRVMWRDLTRMTAAQRVMELALPAPWLAASWWCYARGWLLPGAAASFYLFLAGLRLSHGAQHRHLGIGRAGHNIVLMTLSLLMLMPMHAVRWTHLHHHRHCLDADDLEAATSRMPWWRAILFGPVFPLMLAATAWRRGDAVTRRWIAAEVIGIAALLAVVLGPMPWPVLQLHLLAMAVGESLCGFFAVWTVHHGCHESHPHGRTQRSRIINLLSMSMFFHAEHHLFPAVPTCHLATLAQRLDEAAPALTTQRVIASLPRDTRGRQGAFT